MRLSCLALAVGLSLGWVCLGRGQSLPAEKDYPGAAEFRKATRDLILLVDTERPDEGQASTESRSARRRALERMRLGFELETAGLPCLLIHASMLGAGDLTRPCVKAVVIAGRNRALAPADEQQFQALVRECGAPLLGIGGGMSVVATAWGGKCGSMGRLQNGEVDPDPAYLPGMKKETGYTKIEIRGADPVFAGSAQSIEVMERHSWEVKEVPPGFEVLAGTEACPVQAIRHRTKPVYGLQFLPDQADERHLDGRRILGNFFRVAGIDTERAIAEAQAAFRAQTRGLVRKVCAEPRAMREYASPFVALVDLEAPETVASERKGSGSGLSHAQKIDRVRRRIEGELAGLPCVVVHYIEARRADFANPKLRAIVLSGAANPTVDPMARDLFAVIREARVPMIGLCAGHQHIAEAYGVEGGSMRPLRDGEPDPHPPYHPGMFKEWGFLPVKLTGQDPLFDGLPEQVVMQEYHVAEVKRVPEGFDLLASTEECRIQVLKQRGKPVYGTQFHPECYDDAHPDGRRLLQNFFRIAAEHSGANRQAVP